MSRTFKPRQVVAVTPAVTAGAYDAGDNVGGKQTLTLLGADYVPAVVLTSLSVLDLGNQKVALTVLFFNADPAAATLTDNAAFAWSTDAAKFIGSVQVATGDYVTIGGEGVATLGSLDRVLVSATAGTLYAAVITSGTPTYTSVGDLVFRYGFAW